MEAILTNWVLPDFQDWDFSAFEDRLIIWDRSFVRGKPDTTQKVDERCRSHSVATIPKPGGWHFLPPAQWPWSSSWQLDPQWGWWILARRICWPAPTQANSLLGWDLKALSLWRENAASCKTRTWKMRPSEVIDFQNIVYFETPGRGTVGAEPSMKLSENIAAITSDLAHNIALLDGRGPSSRMNVTSWCWGSETHGANNIAVSSTVLTCWWIDPRRGVSSKYS